MFLPLIFLSIIVDLFISDLVGKLGAEKKIGYSTAFWVSLLFSPIIGLLMVAASVPINLIEKQKKVDDYLDNIQTEKKFSQKTYDVWKEINNKN